MGAFTLGKQLIYPTTDVYVPYRFSLPHGRGISTPGSESGEKWWRTSVHVCDVRTMIEPPSSSLDHPLLLPQATRQADFQTLQRRGQTEMPNHANAFWTKIRNLSPQGRVTNVWRTAPCSCSMPHSARKPRPGHWVVIYAALAYFITPIDAVPDALPGIPGRSGRAGGGVGDGGPCTSRQRSIARHRRNWRSG
jgi:hypothetical protein